MSSHELPRSPTISPTVAGVLGLLDADLSEREAALCFAWSRMGVVETPSPKESLMPFEGFLEALCHLSLLKALPTDEQLAASKHLDASTHLAELLKADKAAFKQMLASGGTEWGEGVHLNGYKIPGGSTADPLPRRLEHMIHVILRRVEVACGQKDPRVLPGTVELTSEQYLWWKGQIFEKVR